MRINRQDTNGVKPLLQTGELGFDNFASGGDIGRVYVGDGTVNIALAKKSEVDAKVVANVDITAGTATKVTYDAKGLVTSGTNPTTLSGYGITDATPSSHIGSTGTAHDVVTTSVNGFMSSTDKSKLDGIAAGAQVNVATDLSLGAATATTIPLNSSTGADVILPAVTTTTAGLMGSADKTKLDGIEAGATGDQTGAEIKSLYESNANTNALTDSLLTLLTTKKVKNVSTDALNDKLVITYTDNTVSNLNINDIITDVHVSGASLDATSNVLTLTSADGGANVTVDLSDFVNSSELTTALNITVKLTGSQTIAGIKTFTSSPIVPTPTTDFAVATKKYVDDSRGLGLNLYQGAYGISWDYATDTYIRTGAKGYTAIQSLMKRCVVKADGTVNYYLNPDNSNFKEDGTPSVLTGADGNVMVEIPKHYIKVETVGNVDSFSVSLTPEAGYVLDPAFLKWNGTAMVEVPYRYFRAYEGSVSGGKLLSVSGVTPTRSQTIATFRTQAMNNGAGWHLTDWNLLNTIRRLCYIEFCDFIVTKYLGEGNYSGSDYGITTGQSNALGNRSSNSTHNDKYMSYRGIENMYADIWEFVDGININNYQAYINQKWSTFASDVFTGDYVAKGPLTVTGTMNGLIKRCAVSADGGFIPTVVGGSTTTFYGDALWSSTGARVAFYGGAAADEAWSGLGTLYVHYASSSSNVSIGAAVCR